ncbi:MAG: RadC family protein [Candidatus Kapaibacterium sp.]|jgi:DNA repair protein RadC
MESSADNEEEKIEYRPIREWRADERPRERLLLHGAASLRESELLAILIGKGTKGYSALDVANDLLNKYGTITEVSSRNVTELAKIKGMGQVKAITLAAAFELVRRVQSAPFSSKHQVRSPEDIARYFIPRMRGARKEEFHVVMLSTANRILKSERISEGSLSASIVHPREVFRPAIIESAAALVLIHNHPSGNTEPSNEDIAITRQLKEAGKIFDIKILDHLIIAGETYTSLMDRGLM